MKKSIAKIITIAIALVVISSCVLTFCACDEEDTSVFKTDTRYNVNYDKLNVMDMNKLIVNVIVAAAIDKNNTYFEFKTDGTMHMQIQTKAGLFADVTALLDEYLPDFDISSALQSFDVEGSVDNYVEPMFPGFKKKLQQYDLQGALALIKHSLGFNIEGLDLTDEKVQAAIKYVGDNMALPGDLLSAIPSDTVLRLTLDTQYAIRDLTAYDGTQFRAIYLGYKVKDNPQTAPFGVFTLTNGDAEGALSVEFMNIHLSIKQAV